MAWQCLFLSLFSFEIRLMSGIFPFSQMLAQTEAASHQV